MNVPARAPPHYCVRVAGRPVAGGGRQVDVDPERLARWLAGFAERHGAPEVTRGAGGALVLAAPDGETAGS